MKLKVEVGFDPAADLAAIAQFAAAWRSQFRPAPISFLPAHFTELLEELGRAQVYRLYLVTQPQEPVALAILEGLNPDDLVDLLALAPNQGPDLVRPPQTSPQQRRALMQGAPAEPGGRGVYCFVLGEPGGLAWLDLEPEGLVLVLARWGGRNVLDPSPLFAQRLRRLGRLIGQLAAPPPE